MGYYTSYNLDVVNIDSVEDRDNIVAAIKEKDLLRYVFSDDWDKTYNEKSHKYGLSFYCWDAQKWYECEDDMCSISAKFPDVVFKITGEGEEWNDKWNMYFVNGCSEYVPYIIEEGTPESIKWPQDVYKYE